MFQKGDLIFVCEVGQGNGNGAIVAFNLIDDPLLYMEYECWDCYHGSAGNGLGAAEAVAPASDATNTRPNQQPSS